MPMQHGFGTRMTAHMHVAGSFCLVKFYTLFLFAFVLLYASLVIGVSALLHFILSLFCHFSKINSYAYQNNTCTLLSQLFCNRIGYV